MRFHTQQRAEKISPAQIYLRTFSAAENDDFVGSVTDSDTATFKPSLQTAAGDVTQAPSFLE